MVRGPLPGNAGNFDLPVDFRVKRAFITWNRMRPPVISPAALSARIPLPRPRFRAAFLSALMLCIAPTAWTQTAAFTADFPVSITVPYSTSQITYSNLPVTNVTSATSSYVTTADYGFVVASVGAPSPGTNLLLNFTPGVPPNGTTNAEVVQIAISNAPGTNGTNRHLTVLVAGPPVMPPQFIDGFTTGTNFITNIFTTNLVTFRVPTTNADFLTVVSNQATANIDLTVGAPTFTKGGAGFAPTNTNDFADQSAFGVLNYHPGTNAATNTFALIASNSVSLQAITSTVSIVSVPLKPLQVRVRNHTGVPDDEVQIMQVDTGTDDFPNNVYFVTNGVQQMGNGISTNFNALPSGADAAGSYRTLYISNSVSGTLWFCLSNVPYNKGTGGNPAVVNTKWSGLPFGNMELAYFGSGYDTADVTAINQLGLPMKLEMKTNPLAPQTLPDGLKGFTNAAQAGQILTNGLQIPAAPWFGPAPNTNQITLVGPSSATAGGVVMSAGGNTNVAGPGPAPGSLHLGWPGFTFPPMSAYVNKVAVEQTNGTWPQPTQIVKTVGDPQSPNVFTFIGTLVFTTNTNTGDPNYLTPVPVLTNVSILVTTNGITVTNITGLWVQYTPDNGSAAQAWFSSYIYGAPASFTNPVGTYDPSQQQGYVQFGPSGADWFAANVAGSSKWSANVLDSFLNDIAFGFAGGFVHSPVNGWTNGWVFTSDGTILSNSNTGAPDTVIGTMVSSNWWNQTNLYSQLQPGSPALSPSNKVTWYSSYGDVLFQSAPDVYNHPISDRMKYIKFQPGLSLGQANLDTNVWLEVTLFPPPTGSGSGAAPAITSSTNVTNVYVNPSSPAGVPISYQVTAVNTNGGGIYVGAMPDGLAYNPATQVISGNLKTNVSGYVNIGLMAYNSNSASIAQLPIYVYASVAPNGFNPVPTSLSVGEAYVAPTNPSSIPEGYSTTVVQLSVSNNSQSMMGSTQDVYFYVTNGTLPRGLYLTNIANPGSSEVFGYFYGVPVDFNATNAVTLVATNPVGSSTNSLTLTNLGYGNNGAANVSAPPVYLGSPSFTVTSGQLTNLVLNYSNSPTYFTNDPATPLPPGLSFQVALNPEYGTASPTFVASLAGTPVGTPGSSTNIKIVAVNAYSNNSPPFVSGTNTNTITIQFSGSLPPSYLSYSGWLGNYPTLSGTNTNPTADPDNDGFDNNDEYAFGGNPTNPTPYLINISGSNISYLGLTNNAVPSPYTVQNTTNLATGPWTNCAATVTNATNQLTIPLPAYYQRKEFTVPVTAGTNNFYRVIFSNQ
jgi:hypothetical protein